MHRKVLLFVLFLISITAFFAWTKLNREVPPLTQGQKEQALEQTLGRRIRQEESIPQGKNTYTGTFFSLAYPAYAKVYDKDNPNITNNTNLLEYLRLDSEEPRFRFTVMVQRAYSTVLEELSEVKVRRQNKLYQEVPITVDGKQGTLFVKASEGVERSSFFLKDGKIFSFSITGVETEELARVYQENLTESVKF